LFFSQSKKVYRIPKACESFQHKGQQDFIECQDPLHFNAFSLKNNLFYVPTSHYEDACRKSKE